MIEIIVLIVMTVAAVRSANTLRRQRALFREFNASETIIPLIYLFPIGPLVLLVFPMFVGVFSSALLALACYLPALYLLRSIRAVFEQSGTDRTKEIQDALSIIFITGLGGVVYVVASTGIFFLVNAGSALR
jgi:hypothetical protein